MNNQVSSESGLFQQSKKNLSYSNLPPVEDIRYYLAELYQSKFGGSIDFSFNMSECPYTLNVRYVKSEGRTRWRLYNNKFSQSNLLWEQETRDLMRIYNLVLSSGETKVQPKLELPVEAPISEAAQNSKEVVAKLRKVFAAGEQDSDGKQKPEPAKAESKIISGDLIDLNIGRQALKNLLLNELGVLSYPAFLLSLLREHTAAEENRTPISVLIIKLALKCNGSKCLLPAPMLGDVLAKIKKLMRKTDIVGQYNIGGAFACVLPDTDIKGSKYLVERINQSLAGYTQDFGLNTGNLELTVGIGSGGTYCNNVSSLLGAAELAFSRAQELGQRVGVFDELFPGHPPAAKNINLNLVRDLVERLIVKEYGIFSFPILVSFLENECNRAMRNKQPCHLLLLSLKNEGGSNESLLKQAMSALVAKVVSLQGNNYLVAQYQGNCVAVFAPKVFAKTLKSFGTEIINSMDDKAVLTAKRKNAYKIQLQISEAHYDGENVNLLRIKPEQRPAEAAEASLKN